MQGNLPQACCRTPREVDEADDMHCCFFSKGVFRDYREYLVKLRKLPEAMLTAPGKRMALERIDFMQEFFTRLNEETQLNLE